MRKQSRALGAEISLAVADLVVTRHPRACGDSIVTMGPNITESGVPHDGIAAAIVMKSARDWPLQRFSKCMAWHRACPLAPGLSAQHFVYNSRRQYSCESKIETLSSHGQSFVGNSQLMQQGGMDIPHRHGLIGRAKSELIRFAK